MRGIFCQPLRITGSQLKMDLDIDELLLGLDAEDPYCPAPTAHLADLAIEGLGELGSDSWGGARRGNGGGGM